jgi:hypothetical protein
MKMIIIITRVSSASFSAPLLDVVLLYSLTTCQEFLL